MSNKFYLQIIIRLCFITLNSVLILFAYASDYVVNTIVLVLILLFQFFLFIDYIKQQFTYIEKSIDCLLYDDYSNTIPKHKRINVLHNKTALLLDKQRKTNLQTSSETLIFNNIIESLDMGVIILRKDSDENIVVFQQNKAFINFLQIPKYYNWDLLKSKIGDLKQYIIDWENIKHTVNIKVKEENETFFLKTSITQTNEYQYMILTIETIQQVIDKKEKETWFKLMNVMSHEIINTITPISSLAESLHLLTKENTENDSILEELSQGLNIINKRSKHLTSFVDNYRKLAELPHPNKEILSINTLISNVIKLFDEEFKSKGVNIKLFTFVNKSIYADKKQIEQVIINLLSNSIHALENSINPKITISVNNNKEQNKVIISVDDNGIGISSEIKNNVFIPYFTTRKNGSGIGLTLSKSIIEAHKGTIKFTSSQQNTTFVITLPNIDNE